MKKRIVVSVSNDLGTDQRVRKQCQSLIERGYDVLLLGRHLPQSAPIERPYAVKRFRLVFNKKAFFYAELNVRLFFFLLFARADLYYANDLDTLPANALASVLRGKPLVYDSHEFFTEVPEIQSRPAVKKVWSFFERMCIARSGLVITVNESIAGLLKKTYGLPVVHVVRNVPDGNLNPQPATREDLGLPTDAHILVLQGSGINVDRGAEELLEAVALLQGVVLLIIGSGDALPALQQRALAPDMHNKVIFKPRMPYAEMMRYTALADLGVSLDKDTNINYRYSLPNKVFDYAAAGIPVLVSDLIEVRSFVEKHGLGVVAKSLEAEALADLIDSTLKDEEALITFRKNARLVSASLTWKQEYGAVLEVIVGLVRG